VRTRGARMVKPSALGGDVPGGWTQGSRPRATRLSGCGEAVDLDIDELLP
jgi:hypothetical protein